MILSTVILHRYRAMRYKLRKESLTSSSENTKKPPTKRWEAMCVKGLVWKSDLSPSAQPCLLPALGHLGESSPIYQIGTTAGFPSWGCGEGCHRELSTASDSEQTLKRKTNHDDLRMLSNSQIIFSSL